MAIVQWHNQKNVTLFHSTKVLNPSTCKLYSNKIYHVLYYLLTLIIVIKSTKKGEIYLLTLISIIKITEKGEIYLCTLAPSVDLLHLPLGRPKLAKAAAEPALYENQGCLGGQLPLGRPSVHHRATSSAVMGPPVAFLSLSSVPRPPNRRRVLFLFLWTATTTVRSIWLLTARNRVRSRRRSSSPWGHSAAATAVESSSTKLGRGRSELTNFTSTPLSSSCSSSKVIKSYFYYPP